MKQHNGQPALAQRAKRVLAQRGETNTLSSLEEELRIHTIELELQNDELLQSRARLEKSRGEFQRLFEAAPVGYLVTDLAGVVQRANATARDLLGDPQLLQQRLGRYVKVQQLAELHKVLEAGPTGRATAEFEFLTRASDSSTWMGRVHTHRLTNKPPCVLVCVEDISALTRALGRARDSELSFRHVIEASPDAMAVVQLGDIVLANTALRDLVGIGEGKAVGTSLLQYVVPGERADLDAAIRASLHKGSSAYLQLHLAANRSAVEMRFATLKYEGTPSVLVVARDITERLRAAADMEHNSRLASLGMLVAGVAHEVNNPLTFLIPNLDDALSRLSDCSTDNAVGSAKLDEVTELIREAREGANRVAAIVKDLKVFHRVKESMDVVDLNQIIMDTLKMAVPKLERRVEVGRDLGNLAPIMGNSGRLGQIILNLVLNAAQAMPATREQGSNRIDIRTWRTDDAVQLQVQDNGRGISETDLKLLFDPFFSKREGGTGLGLTVCASLVREMGGWIEVDSQEGRGTRFVLRFPVATGENGPPAPAYQERLTMRTGLKLLVVDDEPLIFRTIRRSLGSSAELIQATSGREAIEKLAAGLEVDAVLTDLVMPDGTGLELFEWAEQNRPELRDRFIFMTGMAHPETVGELPPRPQLQKPFSMDQVRGAIAETCRQDGEPPKLGSTPQEAVDLSP